MTPPTVSILTNQKSRDGGEGERGRGLETKKRTKGEKEGRGEIPLTEGNDIKEDDIIESLLSHQNTGLNGSSIGDGLIRIDALVGGLAIEVRLKEFLHFGNACGATNKDDLLDGVFLEIGVLQHLVNGLQGLAEEIEVQFFETGTSDGLREVLTVLERLDLNASLRLGGKGLLGTLNFAAKLLDGSFVFVGIEASLLVPDTDAEDEKQGREGTGSNK